MTDLMYCTKFVIPVWQWIFMNKLELQNMICRRLERSLSKNNNSSDWQWIVSSASQHTRMFQFEKSFFWRVFRLRQLHSRFKREWLAFIRKINLTNWCRLICLLKRWSRSFGSSAFCHSLAPVLRSIIFRYTERAYASSAHGSTGQEIWLCP